MNKKSRLRGKLSAGKQSGSGKLRSKNKSGGHVINSDAMQLVNDISSNEQESLQSNYILIGKYQAAFEGEKIVSKAKKNLPTANVSFDSLRTSCLNLNQESSGDVPDPISSKKGYHMMTIQEYSALCLLSLIEYRTTNLQLIGAGNVSGTLQTTCKYFKRIKTRGCTVT